MFVAPIFGWGGLVKAMGHLAFQEVETLGLYDALCSVPVVVSDCVRERERDVKNYSCGYPWTYFGIIVLVSTAILLSSRTFEKYNCVHSLNSLD